MTGRGTTFLICLQKTFTEKKQTNRHTGKPTVWFTSSYTIQKRVISFFKNIIKPSNFANIFVQTFLSKKDETFKKHNDIYLPILQKLKMVTYRNCRGRSIVTNQNKSVARERLKQKIWYLKTCWCQKLSFPVYFLS